MALERLLELIERDAPHANWAQNAATAKFWRSIESGQGQEELLTSYKPRESERQKEQRIAISKTPTPEAFHRITAPMSRLDNPDGLRREIRPGNGKAAAVLLERIGKFHGDKSIDQFVYEGFKTANTTDPNAFLVVTLDGKRGPNGEWLEKPYPRAETVPCEQVYDIGVENGRHVYLVRLQRDIVQRQGKDIERNTYRMYFQDYILEAVNVTPDVEAQMFEIEVNKKTVPYYVTEYYLGNIGETPFIEWGYMRCATGYKSVLEPVETRFRQLINRSSELELSVALHVFLQKYQFTRKCTNHEAGKGVCQNGIFSVTRETCTKCNGTGKHIATSVQDVMLFDLPDTKDEYFPLSEMVHFPTMPFEIVDFLKKELPDIMSEMEQTLWGVNIAAPPSGDTVAVTATEVVGRYETVYKRLSDMGAHIERVWVKCLRLTAKYAEVDAGLSYVYEYPSTYQLETLSELFAILKAAKEAGAPALAIEGIEVQILKKQGQVNTDQIRWYVAATKFRPFKSKTAAEIAGLIAAMPEFAYYRVLHTFFDEIFEEIMNETPMFPNMAYTDQKGVVDAKVAQYSKAVADQMPAAAPARETFNRVA